MKFDLVGKTIAATDSLVGTYFENAIILLASRNEEGSIGLIQNRPFNRDINELLEFSGTKSYPLLEGGPCQQDALYFIHNRSDLIAESQPLNNSWNWQGDFKKALSLYNKDVIQASSIKIFIGYCGWDKGELEAEINEGSWTIL